MKKHLWVEEYAPKTIEECILPETLKGEFLKLKELPCMLLVGDPGVGKTTVAKVLCETHEVDMMFMNASMENGIDEVRNKVNQFASTTALFGGYKVLILDEAGIVYDEYKMDDYRPQYIVIDQDMTIVYKDSTPSGKSPSEEQVLSLLE